MRVSLGIKLALLFALGLLTGTGAGLKLAGVAAGWPVLAGVDWFRFTLAAGAMSLLVLFFMTRNLRHRLAGLVLRADSLGRGENADLRVPPPAPGPLARARGDEITLLERAFTRMSRGLAERAVFKRLAEKIGTPEVFDRLATGALSLRPCRLYAVVLSSEVRGFTAFADTATPEAAAEALARYREKLSAVIRRNGGMVDRFLEDGILAVWGAPEPTSRDVENAVAACLDIRRELVALNHELERDKLPPLRIGMGLNSGQVTAAVVGTGADADYGVIGDTVNTAMRIQGLTRVYGTDLLVSQSVYHLTEGRFLFDAIQNVRLRGKQGPANIFKVSGLVQADGRKVVVETPYSNWPRNEETIRLVEVSPFTRRASA